MSSSKANLVHSALVVRTSSVDLGKAQSTDTLRNLETICKPWEGTFGDGDSGMSRMSVFCFFSSHSVVQYVSRLAKAWLDDMRVQAIDARWQWHSIRIQVKITARGTLMVSSPYSPYSVRTQTQVSKQSWMDPGEERNNSNGLPTICLYSTFSVSITE